MPLQFARRIRNLEIKTYCPRKRKPGDLTWSGGRTRSGSSSSQHMCPSCVLPVVVAFIFGFTVIQLIVIHRTIVSYKSRSLAFEDLNGPSHNDTKYQGDLLAFSKKFDAVWLPPPRNSSRVVEWKPEQSYPYKVPGGISRAAHYPSPINQIWKVACPEVPTKLLGSISIDLKKNISIEELTRNNSKVLTGGRWTPQDCKPRFHVALIIPYRYRWNHLKLLLSILHPMLRRQEMSYQIFVAEQYGNYTFNKGLLMNAAFLLTLNYSNFDCVIFHDVDLLPETDRNIYGCLNSPTHLSVSIDAYGYRLPYSKLVGGVIAFSVNDFITVNGYSNLYWGWGAEDDDMYKRLITNQLQINRPRPDLAKYKMLQHGRRVPNQFINPLIRTARLRFPQDGLTTCHFRLVSSSAEALFTHFLIDVGQPSYSVLQPNIPLESMIPASPSSRANFNNINNNNNPSSLFQQTYQQQHQQNSHPSPLQIGEAVPAPASKEYLHHHQHRSHRRSQQKRSVNNDASSNGSSFSLLPSSSSSSAFSSSFSSTYALKGNQVTSISHAVDQSTTTSTTASDHLAKLGNKESKSISEFNNKGDEEENELFILSGIARDSDNHNNDDPHHNEQQNNGRGRQETAKKLVMLSPKKDERNEVRSRSLGKHFSSSSALAYSVAEGMKGKHQEQKDQQQDDNRNMWLSPEMKNGREENSLSPRVPLDPDVSVMEDLDDDDDVGENDARNL